MRKKLLVVLGSLLVLIWVTGCSLVTTNDVEKAKAEGTSKVYPVTADQAWDIAKAVFELEGEKATEYKSKGYMLASIIWSSGKYGTLMGAWIEPIDKDNTRVTVVTKRRFWTQGWTVLTETTFHKRFAQAVDIIKTGKCPPVAPP
jgi:hypothetical protein